MRGETPSEARQASFLLISIHSPHARGDEDKIKRGNGRETFQSTPLMRGETGKAMLEDRGQ